MARQPKNGGITWTNETWNPIRGCSRVSEGCRNCYAERVAERFAGQGQPYEGVAFPNGGRGVDVKLESLAKGGKSRGWTGDVHFIPELLEQPLRWKRPRKIFVNSMADLFHEKVPIEWIADIFNVMACATVDCGKNHQHVEECWCGPSHTFQILTKRPKRMLEILRQLPEYFAEHFNGDCPCNLAFERKNGWPLPNVWLGVSVEDQKTADERIPLLLQTPAAVRWVSYEPALTKVDFGQYLSWGRELDGTRCENDFPYGPIDWLVAGGESGPGARPCHPQWIRIARDQCAAYKIPFFFKQWGEWLNSSQLRPAFSDAELDRVTFRTVRREPEDNMPNAGLADLYFRVGKKRAGHLLDGIPWQEFPRSERIQ